jgi:hypothetical protein
LSTRRDPDRILDANWRRRDATVALPATSGLVLHRQERDFGADMNAIADGHAGAELDAKRP